MDQFLEGLLIVTAIFAGVGAAAGATLWALVKGLNRLDTEAPITD